MPMQSPCTNNVKTHKIRRSHSGCRPCRRRGKRCDETKPTCRACTRLSLECSYGVNYSFRNFDGALVQQHASTRLATPAKPRLSDDGLGTKHSLYIFNPIEELSNRKLPASLCSEDDVELSYLNHFVRHVRYLFPAAALQCTDGFLHSPCLRFAVLCISASNLSMLNARVQSRILTDNSRRSVFSPLVNHVHHDHAQKYHDLAVWYYRNAELDEVKHQAPALLAAHILLAYYHHASTNHLRFRLAVADSVRFVLQNRANISDSPEGADSLQMWYRLCTSHRPAKPPALLLEGEGVSSFGQNLLPDVTEHLYLRCIVGMSVDDLIYDILIKTLEIRTKMVVFRCVAGIYQISELSSEIGSRAHEVLNKMLGRECLPEEYAEAREGFVRGSHLKGLLEVQRERLKVWRSRLSKDQQPFDRRFNPCKQCQPSSTISACPTCQQYPSHRDAMNALYCMLCEMAFEEADENPTSDGMYTTMHNHSADRIICIAYSVCQIASRVNYALSNNSDVYTLSLAEVLLQLVFLSRSNVLFHYILDVLWPQLEMNGRGYEHSHYPTHLVKRVIAQIAEYWEEGRVVTYALPAVAENISKFRLLDIDHPVELVVCGYNMDGKHFIEKVPLP